MNEIHRALHSITGDEPKHVSPMDASNNDVLRIETEGGRYILKRFERERRGAYRREVGMRHCLRRFTSIAFPAIVGSAELGRHRYVLMEDAAGETLEELWKADPARARGEIDALGRLLGSLHTVPAAEAKRFLERDDVLYTEDYFAWMVKTIAPYVTAEGWTRRLRACYEVVTSMPVEEVVIHADFGPHQVVVDSQGRWLLVDFEYAGLGAFADDLAGAELRLERSGHPHIEAFLRGYEQVRGALSGYESVRPAYKAYNLLAILTYRAAYKGEEPPAGELRRLEKLLAGL